MFLRNVSELLPDFMGTHFGRWYNSKGKVGPALRHEGVWESECIDPYFLDLGSTWK
jgi:hypothetical protein